MKAGKTCRLRWVGSTRCIFCPPILPARANYANDRKQWAAAGLVRVIAALPAERAEDKQRMVAFLKKRVDGCLAYQRPDGLFYDVLDKPATFVETNLAQVLAYAIYRAVPAGGLSANYIPAADRMRQAVRSKMDEQGYVQGVCGAPGFDHARVAAEGQAFFILMAAAWLDYRGEGTNSSER